MATFDAILKESGLYSPDEYEKKAGAIESARQQAVQPFIERAKARAAKTEGVAEKIRGVETPDAPKLEKLPDEPDIQFKDPIQAIGSIGSMLAFIGSLRTRAPLTTSLNAASAAIEGFHKGDKEAIALERTKWKDSLDKAVKQNDSELKSYEAALQKSGFDITKAQSEMHVIAAQNKDDAMLAAIESGNYEKQQEILTQRQNLGGKLAQLHEQDALRRLQIESNAEIRKMMYGGGAASMDPNQIKSAGAQVAAGMPLNQVVPGYGRAATGPRNAVRQEAINQIMSQNPGMSAVDAGGELARRQLDFAGVKGSTVQLQRMLGATKPALDQLEFNVKKTTETLDKMEGSDISPVINAIIRGEQKWTGDPMYSQLFYYMTAAGMESARIMANGQASIQQLHEGAREEAKQWASAGFTTPAAWKEGVAPAMIAEGENRVKNFEDALDYQRRKIGSGDRATGGVREFATEEEAIASGVKGKVKIGGRSATIQ